MKTYNIKVYREGKWWMVEIPELDGLTQARRLGEAQLMGREWIALATEAEVEDVDVSVEVILPAAASALIEGTSLQREIAARATAAAADFHRLAARELTAAGLPVRDVGFALGVSHQRAHQLVNEPVREYVDVVRDIEENRRETAAAEYLAILAEGSLSADWVIQDRETGTVMVAESKSFRGSDPRMPAKSATKKSDVGIIA